MPTHVEVRPPDGGLRDIGFVMCEQIRSLTTGRLGQHPFGHGPAAVLRSVEESLRFLHGM
ncbi:MAG: type II toxin-antitoxin system PemK/MazF family toxin [Actinomycetota bacterium]